MSIKPLTDELSYVNYINFPRKLNAEDYLLAQEQFIEKFSAHPDVISIYSFGSISQPGISDLDFIVVLDEQLRQPISRDFGFDIFDEKTSFILSHNPVLISVDNFRDYWKIFPISGSRLVYGEDLLQTHPDLDEEQFYQTLNLIDICSRYYPLIFLKMLHSSQFDVRRAIQFSNALVHALNLGSQIIEKPNKSWSIFALEVEEIKKLWFDMDTWARLCDLRNVMNNAITVSVELVREIDKYVNEHYWGIQPDIYKKRNYCGFWEIGRYLSDHRIYGEMSEDFDVVTATIMAYKETNVWWRILPSSFFLPIAEYANGIGDYSQKINKLTFGRRDIFLYKDETLSTHVQAKSYLLNQRFQFFHHNKIGISMLHQIIPILDSQYTPRSAKGIDASIDKLRMLKRRYQFWFKLKKASVFVSTKHPILY